MPVHATRKYLLIIIQTVFFPPKSWPYMHVDRQCNYSIFTYVHAKALVSHTYGEVPIKGLSYTRPITDTA